MAKFTVSFILERDDKMKSEDESFFDKQNISDEIQSWLSDLDFAVSNINVQEKKTSKLGTNPVINRYLNEGVNA